MRPRLRLSDLAGWLGLALWLALLSPGVQVSASDDSFAANEQAAYTEPAAATHRAPSYDASSAVPGEIPGATPGATR